MPVLPGYMTVYEAADEIGVSHSQVTRYIAGNRIEAEKIGNQWFVKAASVRKFKRPPRGNPQFVKK